MPVDSGSSVMARNSPPKPVVGLRKKRVTKKGLIQDVTSSGKFSPLT